MMGNPEFRRNLWLELTRHRLISMPLILAVYFFLLYVLGGHQLTHNDSMQALFITGLLLLLWGANMTAESVLSEVRDNTWDAQRMSAMSAWKLVWGKLLGSSVFSWYGAVFSLSLFVMATDFGYVHSLKVVLMFVFSGLLAQAISMLLALMSIRKSYQMQRSHALAFTLVAAFTATSFISESYDNSVTMTWFGLQFLRLDFSLYMLLAWLGWSWIGCFRLMRSELQSPNRIWVWLAFVSWLLVFMAGFMPSHLLSASLPYLVLSLTIVLAYIMVFSESKNPIAISRMLRCLRQRDWQHLQFALPCWLLNLVLMLLASLLLPLSSGQNVELAGVMPVAWFFDYFSPTLMFTTVMFVIRDMCIILWLNFSINRKRADFAAVLYLALSYGLFPVLLAALGMDAVRMLFLPIQEAGLIGLIVAVTEAAAFFWLMQNRWQANFGRETVAAKQEA